MPDYILDKRLPDSFWQKEREWLCEQRDMRVIFKRFNWVENVIVIVFALKSWALIGSSGLIEQNYWFFGFEKIAIN